MLRQAGQSLREEIDQLAEARLLPLLFVPVVFMIVWAVECLQKRAGRALNPEFWVFMALLVTIYGGFEVFRLRPRTYRFGAGKRGHDRRVSEILDRIRAKGFAVFHDLPEDGFNIDHVVIGPSGIYAIETKTRSGSGSIDYSGDEALILGGKINEARALRQARASAGALCLHLKDYLNDQLGVKSLLVFVGDWRVQRAAGDFNVDVIAANQLEDYFDRQQPELTRSQIAQICAHLERLARA